jgi:Protein of unknown function (DUF4236)
VTIEGLGSGPFRINLSSGGISTSFGIRGVRIHVPVVGHHRKPRLTVGIPGSGFSYTQSIGNSEPQPIKLNSRAARVMRRTFEIATEGEPQELRDAIACIIFEAQKTPDDAERVCSAVARQLPNLSENQLVHAAKLANGALGLANAEQRGRDDWKMAIGGVVLGLIGFALMIALVH